MINNSKNSAIELFYLKTFFLKEQLTTYDGLVKSLEIVMPDPVSGTGHARSGIQNALNLLDSGFRRNDGKENFSTFYEFIKIDLDL